MTHQRPGASKKMGGWGKSEETQLCDSDYSVLSRGVFSIRTVSLQLLGPLSRTTTLSLVMRGSPDTHRIPFDKLRPLGNKIAVVGTELWHTAANWVPGLLQFLWPHSGVHSSSLHSVSPLPPSRPWIRIVVSQGAPPDPPEFAFTNWYQHCASECEV